MCTRTTVVQWFIANLHSAGYRSEPRSTGGWRVATVVSQAHCVAQRCAELCKDRAENTYTVRQTTVQAKGRGGNGATGCLRGDVHTPRVLGCGTWPLTSTCAHPGAATYLTTGRRAPRSNARSAVLYKVCVACTTCSSTLQDGQV